MRLGAAARWLVEYSLAGIAAALLLFAAAAGVYAWVVHEDQTSEEILDESFELVSLTRHEAVLHIWGRKHRGFPIALTTPRTCPVNGEIRSETDVDTTSCTPGETVEVLLSPRAYGVRADGTRRPITMRGGPIRSYPEGRFDAGRWTFGIAPRWPGDPPIVAVEVEVTHERRFGPVAERFDAFPLGIIAGAL